MKRKITFLLSALIALTLITQSFSAMGQEKTTTYKLTQVTSVSKDNKYVFLQDGHVMNNSISDSYLGTTDSYNTTNLSGTEGYIWTLEASTNGFYFKNVAGGKYLSSNGSNAKLSWSNSGSVEWTFSFDSNGIVTIKSYTNANKFLGYSSASSYKYRAYANTTANLSSYPHAITVYILEEETNTPTITVSPNNLTGLSYDHGNGPSTAKSFIASGTNLTEMIVVDAPTHYEISRDNSTFKDTLQLRQHGGTVSGTTIYARLKADQNVGTYNSENVTLNSDGATEKTVSLSGTVSGYTVTYDSNGGSNGPANASNQPSGDYTISSTVPTKTNYTFGGWNDGSTTYAAGATYPLTSNVTLTAQWTPDTYDYTLNVTGEDAGATASVSVGGETLDEGDKIAYNAIVTINVSVSTGYGYSISVKDSGNKDVTVDDDNKFTMPASAVTITVTTEVNPYLQAKLTGTNMSNMSNAGTGYGTEKSITLNGLTWSTTGYQTTNYKNMIQLNTGYIKLPVFDGKIVSVAFDVTDASATSFSEGSNKTNRYLYFRESDGGQNKASDGGSNTNHLTLNVSESYFYNTGYIQASGAIRIWKITVTYLPYSNFTDLDPSDPMPDALSAGDNVAVPSNMSTESLTIPATAALVVKSGATLTLSGTLTNQGTAANLVIEDGGQLIHTNAVNATLHKEVTGYNDPSVTTGWYTIASPVAGLAASTVATTEDYDLFAYQESNFTWLNTLNNTLTFAEGQGFLYANSADQTLAYAGSMKATNAEVSINLSYTAGAGALAGYNLVGNPFSRNLTSGEVKVGGSAITTYYVSEGGSNLTPRAIADYPIKPGQGFFVQATGTGQQIVFNPGSKDYESTNKPAFISIEASNSSFTDRAYVQLGGGNTLRKMSVNDNVHSLYVMQDGKDYASATIDSYNGSIPVCFKATETGRYTINVQTTGIDADYLHLIDRYTGADVDLLSEPSYTFIATKDDYESRFTLVFTADGSDTNNDIFAYQSGSAIIVNGNGDLQIFDVTGRRVMTTTINGMESINIPNQGVYIFKLNEKVQKIVVR